MFTEVDDLCKQMASRDINLADISKTASLTIVACHPRTVKWLLHAQGLNLPADRLLLLDLRTMPANAILDSINEASPLQIPEADVDDTWRAWYPVIDLSGMVTDILLALSYPWRIMVTDKLLAT